MDSLIFKPSEDFTLGIELEYQLINPKNYNLCSKAKELIDSSKQTQFDALIKPEITQSMLELNSSVHLSAQNALKEMRQIQSFLLKESKSFNVKFSGGGTHPFMKWVTKKIFPSPRFKKLARRYQYLSKQATVFGLHVHVGVSSTARALYLTHALARYVPQLIAMSASSPFYAGVDSGFNSTRSILFNTYPTSGTISPDIKNWKQFCNYFFKLKNLGLVESMKDFYWDIRPKPEYGTVEIRVCDTPLTFMKAIMISAYIQTLACYLLEEQHPINKEVYTFYNINRFKAARYGLKGLFIDPYSLKKCEIGEDILKTIELFQQSSIQLKTTPLIKKLARQIKAGQNDAKVLRQIYDETGSLKKTVEKQCNMWLE